MADLKNNEFIEIEGTIMNVGSIVQVLPNNNWAWADDNRTKKKDLFTIHFLGAGSLDFDMKHYEKVKKKLLKE